VVGVGGVAGVGSIRLHLSVNYDNGAVQADRFRRMVTGTFVRKAGYTARVDGSLIGTISPVLRVRLIPGTLDRLAYQSVTLT
jgi:hypothetical protein